MKVEVTIAKEKARGMPKGALEALQREFSSRLNTRFHDVEVLIRTASSDGLTVSRAADKDGDRKIVEQMLQNTWESADDWFCH